MIARISLQRSYTSIIALLKPLNAASFHLYDTLYYSFSVLAAMHVNEYHYTRPSFKHRIPETKNTTDHG